MPYIKNLKTISLYKKIFLIFVIVSILIISLRLIIPNQSKYLNNKPNILKGIIKEYEIKNNTLSIEIQSKEKVQAFYYIKNDLEKEELIKTIGYGSEVSLTGKFILPQKNTIPNCFSYQKYLYNKQIYYVFQAKMIKCTRKSKGIYKLKNILIKKCEAMSDDAYFRVLLTGKKGNLNQDMLNKIGCLHLFIISGFHIQILLLIIKKILLKMGWHNKLILILSTSFLAFFYGFTISILRVSIFYTLKCINDLLKKPYQNLELFIITFFICLLINPNNLFDWGFRYSFLITFFLFIVPNKYHNKFSKLLYINIVCFLVSLPLVLINNYEVNFLAIIYAFFSSLYLSFIMYPLALLSFVMPLILPIFNIFSNIFNQLLIMASNIDIGILIIGKVPFFLWFIYYYLIYLILVKERKKEIVLLVIYMYLIYLLPSCDKFAYIGYLDVLQGDCAVMISPYKREVIVIDTGGKVNDNNTDYIAKNIATYLKSMGVKKINTLIITHGDYDHMGSSLNLIDNIKVLKVVFNEGKTNELEQKLIQKLQKKKIKYVYGLKQLKFADSKLTFLKTTIEDNENDNSNIIYLKYQTYQFLFMGDASIKKEEELIKKYNLRNISFLKVGHHGSKNSSSKKFIDTIKPKYSIISVGKNNNYHHPHQETLEKLKNSKIYRTDELGSIIVTLKNNQFQIKTYEP